MTTAWDWLDRRAGADALLDAWRRQPTRAANVAEIVVLAAVAASAQNGQDLAVELPSGISRLPLLAAAHNAALRLARFPSPFRPADAAPVALLTRGTVRRRQLLELDAAGVRVSDALKPVRLRGDGLVSPLLGGRAKAQHATQLLIVATGAEPVPELPPRVVIVDGVGADENFRARASAWAAECGATQVTFRDVQGVTGLSSTPALRCGWRFMSSMPSSGDPLLTFALERGQVAAHLVGSAPELATASSLISAASRHGAFPTQLVEASTLLRRFSELVVPIDMYDAACHRWHTPTLTERVEDLADVRSDAFPKGWRTWAETSWAAIKHGVIEAAQVAASRPKQQHLLKLVDAELAAGRELDIAVPSRTARDALLCFLWEAGIPLPTDGSLSIRSIRDEEPWGPPRASVLVSPLSWSTRRRLTGADIGALNVLCYEHELAPLQRSLSTALGEPDNDWRSLHSLLPPLLGVEDQPERRIDVAVRLADVATAAVSSQGTVMGAFDAIDMAALAALEASQQDFADLPDDDDPEETRSRGHTPGMSARDVLARAAVVSPVGTTTMFRVNLPTEARVTRIVGETSSRLPVLSLEVGMLVVGVDGLSPFERLRPLLLESRGPVARLFLTAWDQALDMALRATGSSQELAVQLQRDGATILPAAVAEWSAPERIGPIDRENVARVGVIANHPIVRDQAGVIADVMVGLRQLHRSVGALVAGGRPDPKALDVIENLLGPDGVSIAQQIVVYRVIEVHSPTLVLAATLYRQETVAMTSNAPVI